MRVYAYTCRCGQAAGAVAVGDACRSCGMPVTVRLPLYREADAVRERSEPPKAPHRDHPAPQIPIPGTDEGDEDG